LTFLFDEEGQVVFLLLPFQAAVMMSLAFIGSVIS
jgi:hypothetical protein